MIASTTSIRIQTRQILKPIVLISLSLMTASLFAQMPAVSSAPAADTSASDSAKAAEPAPSETSTRDRFNYIVGFALVNSSTYLGASDRQFKAQPFFAVQYGRFSISDSRATGITDFGGGASYALLDQSAWKASVGLRVDNGRKSGDSPKFAGLPDIERTLRGRVSASWAPMPRWSMSASAQPDLLGRKGGTVLSLGVSHAVPINERQRASFSAGTSFGDATYMNSYFGIDNTAALAPARAPFRPGSGIRDVGVSATHNFRINQRWFLMSSLSGSRLLGSAADSPLTEKKNQVTASISVAYQCCK